MRMSPPRVPGPLIVSAMIPVGRSGVSLPEIKTFPAVIATEAPSRPAVVALTTPPLRTVRFPLAMRMTEPPVPSGDWSRKKKPESWSETEMSWAEAMICTFDDWNRFVETEDAFFSERAPLTDRWMSPLFVSPSPWESIAELSNARLAAATKTSPPRASDADSETKEAPRVAVRLPLTFKRKSPPLPVSEVIDASCDPKSSVAEPADTSTVVRSLSDFPNPARFA